MKSFAKVLSRVRAANDARVQRTRGAQVTRDKLTATAATATLRVTTPVVEKTGVSRLAVEIALRAARREAAASAARKKVNVADAKQLVSNFRRSRARQAALEAAVVTS